MDPYKSSYGVEDPEFAITQLAQTTMRSEIGKMEMDGLFKERENLNISIVQSINLASEAWGIQCMRYEIRDIKLPERIQLAMQMQVEAERKKRAAILESEGTKASEIDIAEALSSQKGTSAANLAVAENYVKAFGNLAKSSNTLMLPGNAGDISTMVTQALTIYKKLDVQQEIDQGKQEEKISDES